MLGRSEGDGAACTFGYIISIDARSRDATLSRIPSVFDQLTPAGQEISVAGSEDPFVPPVVRARRFRAL